MAVSSVTSTSFSLVVVACVGTCCMNSCCLSLACGFRFDIVSSLMAWFRRFLLSRPLLPIVHASSKSREEVSPQAGSATACAFLDAIPVKGTREIRMLDILQFHFQQAHLFQSVSSPQFFPLHHFSVFDVFLPLILSLHSFNSVSTETSFVSTTKVRGPEREQEA